MADRELGALREQHGDPAAYIADHGPWPDQLAAQNETARIVGELLGRLSEDHRTAIVLVYFHNLTLPEAAAVVGERPGTMKTRLFYARKRLHAMVNERFGSLDRLEAAVSD